MVKEKAQLKILSLNAEMMAVDKIDMITDFVNRGLPQVIVNRLNDLWDFTKDIAGEVISIGKIILTKIWEFVKENTNMSIGIVIGVAIGSLVNLIPFLGPLLSPIAIIIGAIVGGTKGEKLDRLARGEVVSDNEGVIDSLIIMAKKFFHLISDIFNTLKTDLT